MDIHLHIGSGKTGTSSIQRHLATERDALAAAGVLYPISPGEQRHTELGLYAHDDAYLARQPRWRGGGRSPDHVREHLRTTLLEEVDRYRPDHLILSDEALFGLRAGEIERLGGLLAALGGRLHLIAYLRRQDDHLISRYQQAVKTGEVRTLAEYAWVGYRRAYDYRRLLHDWSTILGPDRVTVRRFERGAFVDRTLIEDFADAVGVPGIPTDRATPVWRNTSLDADSVTLLRLWNLKRVTYNRAKPGRINNNHLVEALAPLSDGPVLSLPAEELDRWMERWQDGNQAVARKYLNDPDGLFAVPRVSAVQTEQRVSAVKRERLLRAMPITVRSRNQLREVWERERRARPDRPERPD